MLGGPPIMNQPVYFQSPPLYPGSLVPAAPSVPAGNWSGRVAAAVSAPASTPSTWPSPPATPKPVFRAKGPDEPVAIPQTQLLGNRPKLSMPTPEQLGIAPPCPANPSKLDRTAAREQLEGLGAIGSNFERLETGGWRFACLLPTRQPSVTHRVEAEAATAADAVNLALAQAEKWASAETRSAK